MDSICRELINRCLVIFFLLGMYIAQPAPANDDIFSKASCKDIQENDLIQIEKLLDGVSTNFESGKYRGQVTVLLQTLEKLSQFRKLHPFSQRTDKLLFLSGRARIAMGRLIAVQSELPANERAMVETYQEKHQKDYLIALGVAYQGSDFQAIIDNYPDSPLASEAAFIIATEGQGVGECESDMNCHLHRVIDAYSSFIDRYPTHPKYVVAVDAINAQLRGLANDPREEGLHEIFDIEDTTALLKSHYAVVTKMPDADLRADSLYLLARAFISVGQFELADKIYNDLESHYPKYRNARRQAAYMVIDYAQRMPADIGRDKETLRFTAQLSDPTEKGRLEALDRIYRANISDRALLFSVLMAVGNLSEKDKSPKVRKRAIEVVGKLAPQTSFFRAAVGYCLLYDGEKTNRYFCADLGINHPDLASTDFYAYNNDRINSIISEATGKTYPSDELIREWQRKAMQRDLEAVEEILRRGRQLQERKN